jgi:exonuclease VII small subunit
MKKLKLPSLKRIQDQITLTGKTIKELSDCRDKLREQIEELENIQGSLDMGLDAFETAMREFKYGIDEISGVL